MAPGYESVALASVAPRPRRDHEAETDRRNALALCVFAKAPRAGHVKTRLARSLGEEVATRLAGAFLDDTWERTKSLATTSLAEPGPHLGVAGRAACGVNAHAVLALDGEATSCNSVGPDDEIWPQGTGDLGERMEPVLRRALTNSRAAVALGTDSPGLPLYLLEQAQAALLQADAVLGPSVDGGFYLLALKRCPRGLLAQLPWSAEDTFEQTLRRLRAAGMRVAVIDSWFDVDEFEDLSTLTRLLETGAIEAPRTREILGHVSLKSTEGLGHDKTAADAPRISVIIPTLNEHARIDTRLRELSKMRDVCEVFVVDGDSDDDTAERARRWPGVRVLRSDRGRARQLNAGARYATGDVLLFLHADVELPSTAAECIADVMRTSAMAGCFKIHTVDDSPRRRRAPWLRLADVRSRTSALPYGDQAIFVRSEIFRDIGGYPVQPLMEDLEFSRRLRRKGRIRRARANVRVSGRRFLARPVYYTLMINTFPLLYRLGVPPEILAKLYLDPR